MIRIEGLGKVAGETRILRGVSLEVEPRTVLGIIGPSGSGKTTLLRCMNGFERISEGTLEAGGVRLEAGLNEKEYQRRVKQLRRRVGMVFQHFYLFPHLSVLGNISEAPVHVLKRPRADVEAEARQLLETVGLGAGDRVQGAGERVGRVHAARRHRLGLLPADESPAGAPRAAA